MLLVYNGSNNPNKLALVDRCVFIPNDINELKGAFLRKNDYCFFSIIGRTIKQKGTKLRKKLENKLIWSEVISKYLLLKCLQLLPPKIKMYH